jgi:hypothetical protein
VILFHPRFQFGRHAKAVDEFIEVRGWFELHGLLADVFEAFAQEVKRQLADRLGPSVRRGHLRGEFDAPRRLCRKPSWRGYKQQPKNDYGTAKV